MLGVLRGLGRVAIVGNAGGGKTSVARRLQKMTELPLHHIDALRWKAGWVERPLAEYVESHDTLIAKEEWIIEGMGDEESMYRRLTRAQHIIFIELGMETHIELATKRVDTPTETAPDGCSYADKTAQVVAVIKNLEESGYMTRLRTALNAYSEAADGPKVHRLTNVEQLDSFEQWFCSLPSIPIEDANSNTMGTSVPSSAEDAGETTPAASELSPRGSH